MDILIYFVFVILFCQCHANMIRQFNEIKVLEICNEAFRYKYIRDNYSKCHIKSHLCCNSLTFTISTVICSAYCPANEINGGKYQIAPTAISTCWRTLSICCWRLSISKAKKSYEIFELMIVFMIAINILNSIHKL